MLSDSQFKLRSKLKTGVFTLCIIILASCKNDLKKDIITQGDSNFKSSIKYAKGFDIQIFDT